MKTTLKKIWQHNPCEGSWKKLLQSLGKTEADDTEVSVRYILDLLGIDDAIWVLRAVDGHDREVRLFACDCAESVLHLYEDKYPDDNRPRKAIEVSRKYAECNATIEELSEAGYAASSGAWSVAAWAARWAAAADASAAAACAARAAARAVGAEEAAWSATWAASAAAEREKQKQFLLKYLQ